MEELLKESDPKKYLQIAYFLHCMEFDEFDLGSHVGLHRNSASFLRFFSEQINLIEINKKR